MSYCEYMVIVRNFLGKVVFTQTYKNESVARFAAKDARPLFGSYTVKRVRFWL